MQISRFLLEFSKFARSCPHFRRLGIEISVLERFGLLFDELKDVIHNSSSSQHSDLIEDASPGQHESKPEGFKANTPALKGKDKYFIGVQKQDTPRFPTPKIASGNLYLYLRWIWIQFPWLALYPAATVAMKANASADATDSNDGNEDIGNEAVLDESMKDLFRVWNVKKSDPSIAVYTSSLNRKLAAIKPRNTLSANLERNINLDCKRLYDELSVPSHIAQARLGVGIPQKDKFRRNFDQEVSCACIIHLHLQSTILTTDLVQVEVSKSLPFAYHDSKTMKSRSLFPSYNASVRESNRKKVEADIFVLDAPSDTKLNRKKPLGKFNLDKALRDALGGDVAAAQPTFFLTELDDEICKLTHDEYLHSHVVDAAAGSLIKDEIDLEVVSLHNRVEHMKSISDKLLIVQKEKDRALDELENEVLHPSIDFLLPVSHGYD